MIRKDIRITLENKVCCCLKQMKDDENDLLDDGKFYIFKKFEHSILIYGKRRSYFPFHCSVGLDWPIVIFVYILIIVINGAVLGILSGMGWPVLFIGLVGFSVLILSYTATACSDPGIIYANDYKYDLESANKPNTIPTSIECGQCHLHRPFTARHCSYCNVCIDELDHHCPWCGKCIGKDNIRQFNIFVVSLMFQIYFLIGASIYYAVQTYADSMLPLGPNV